MACSSTSATRPAPPAPATITPATPATIDVEDARRETSVEMSPMGLVVTARHVVWTDQAGAIWTMAIGGGQPRQLSDQKQTGFASSLVRAGDRVLATSRRGVFEVALPAGPVTALPIDGLPEQPEDAAADAEHIYLTIFKRDDILRVPLAGGRAERIARIPRGVLALFGRTLYVASYSQGTLSSIPVGGGAGKLIARGLPRPTALAVDSTHAYVYCERDRILRKIDLASGAMVMLATELINSDDVVVDDAWVYTRSWGKPHVVVRIPKAGGAPQVIADDLRAPYRIAVDARAIYVTSRDDKRIVRIPKASLAR